MRLNIIAPVILNSHVTIAGAERWCVLLKMPRYTGNMGITSAWDVGADYLLRIDGNPGDFSECETQQLIDFAKAFTWNAAVSIYYLDDTVRYARLM